jgi:DNA-binding CsgD family transcriptional regulator
MDARSELLLSLYSGARGLPSSEFQAFALRLLRPALRFQSAILGLGYFEGSNAPALVPLSSATDQIDPAGFAEWKQINRADKIIPIVRFQPRTTFNFHAPTVFSGKSDLVMRDYARRFGRQSYLVTALTDIASPIFEWCSIYRPDPDDQFTEGERSHCQSLMNHLCEALTINRLVQQSGATGADLREDESAALVSNDGRILAAQPGFLAACRKQWAQFGLCMVPRPAMAQLTRERHGTFRGRSVTLRSKPLGGFLYVIAISPPRREPLTPRRMDIASLFADGQSAKDIARTLGISPATVRNQLSSAYRHLGVSSRRELRRALHTPE